MKIILTALLCLPSTLCALNLGGLPKLQRKPGGGPVSSLLDRVDRVEADAKASRAAVNEAAAALRGLAAGTPADQAMAAKRADVAAMKKSAKNKASQKAALAAEQALYGEEISAFSKAEVLDEIKKSAAGAVKKTDPARLLLGLAEAGKAGTRAAQETAAIAAELPAAKDGVSAEFSNPIEAARTSARLVEAPARLEAVRAETAAQAREIVELTRAFKALAGK